MKLLVVAVLVAVTSAARLEHLERSYLPPDNTNVHGSYGNNGFGSNVGSQNGFSKGTFGNGFNSGTNGFGQNSNGLGSNGHGSNGFGGNGHTSNGIGANGHSARGTFGSNGGSVGSNGFGANGASGGQYSFGGATSNQYLPPKHGSFGSGSNGFNIGGSSIKPACSSCGSSSYPSQQYNHGSRQSIPSASYGVPQFGSSFGVNTGANLEFGSPSGSNFGNAAEAPSTSAFGSAGTFGSNSFGSQGAASRQYLAPKTTSQNIPQQPFDEKYGYIY